MEQTFHIVIGDILKTFSPVSPYSISLVIESGEIVSYEKGDVIFLEKKYNAFEYFQLEGIAHRYNLDAEEQQTTTGIYKGPTVITPHFARTIHGQCIFLCRH